MTCSGRGLHPWGEHVRRSLTSLLVALGPLATTLGAQSLAEKSKAPGPHAIDFGLVATLGANWQNESAEIGYVRRPARGLAAIGLAGRVGTFVNESAMLGETQGVVFAATLSARTHRSEERRVGKECR